MEALQDIATNFGLPVAIMLFYIWRDWKREQSMTVVIADLTSKLMVITENSTDAVSKFTQAIEKLTDRIDKIA